MSEVIVIGGGAAGMMAAYAAASNGHRVCLLEKNEKLGKKIYITGKGRCNFTNACDFPDFIGNIVSNPRFMYSSGREFGPQDMIAFLEDSGCRTKTERGNRAFPLSDHASDVTKALEKRMDKAGVRVMLKTEVKEITKDLSSGRFRVHTAKNRILLADAVIVCTGGLSYPSTGSTGDGYRFASEFGLRVNPCSPALVPLSIQETDAAALQGVSLKAVSVKIHETGADGSVKKKAVYESEPGELLFTHFGLSGPLILKASSLITKGLSEGKRYRLSIDLKPGLTPEMLNDRILRDLEVRQNMQIENALDKLLIAALRPLVLERAGIDPAKRVRDLQKQERIRLACVIKDLVFTVDGTRGYMEAVITQGGVSVKDVDPKTMEAKQCPGLYFAGEVLDVDAFTGGFNLQIAWSTGHAAGSSIL